MEYTASIRSTPGTHQVTVTAGGQGRALDLPARSGAPGSAVSGGELLFLALATCATNDVYREAAARSLPVVAVDVEVAGWFDAPGARARDVSYRVSVVSPAPEEQVRELVAHVDAIAEVHGTLRTGTTVSLDEVRVSRPPEPS
ncbi:OsmC family protein [Cellulomonas sp. zg-ZUI22]|uniref:OsmC family protein n=1 Tax=Cellulomonas sp. zg-ZUI22 TaxID=2816955 RepID=UPI001A940B3A|nr:OsmC family protein [Cellulomonas sp. zg-ZUI22]MBO0898688.1 OsmC family protein [Cellulomonas sp. zg-ZUI22]